MDGPRGSMKSNLLGLYTDPVTQLFFPPPYTSHFGSDTDRNGYRISRVVRAGKHSLMCVNTVNASARN